jgi:hypothetical protein
MSGLKCAIPWMRCSIEPKHGFEYCFHHKCHADDCTKPQESFNLACKEHMCRFVSDSGEGCGAARSDDGIHCYFHKQMGECECDFCVHPTKSAHKV